jgi:hypothetical protein
MATNLVGVLFCAWWCVVRALQATIGDALPRGDWCVDASGWAPLSRRRPRHGGGNSAGDVRSRLDRW